MTKLTKAVKKGDLKLVNELINNNVDIHAYDDAALMWSARRGFLDIVKVLVEHGANINNSNSLKWSVKNNHIEVVKYLISKGADINFHKYFNAFRIAAEEGYVEIVKYLVENCNVDIHEHYSSAFQAAIDKNHIEVVRYLVSKGAVTSETFLDLAETYGHEEIVKIIKAVA